MAKLLRVKDRAGRIRWVNLDFVIEVRANPLGGSELIMSKPFYFAFHEDDDKMLSKLLHGEYLRRSALAKESVEEIAALMSEGKRQ